MLGRRWVKKKKKKRRPLPQSVCVFVSVFTVVFTLEKNQEVAKDHRNLSDGKEIMGKPQLYYPRVFSPRILLKIHWRRKSERRDLCLSPPMGFENDTRREDTRRVQLRLSHFSFLFFLFFTKSRRGHYGKTV